MVLTIALAVCLTPAEMRDQWCAISCYRGGWDSGYWASGRCACVDYVNPKDFVETKLASLPRKPEGRIYYGGIDTPATAKD